jgi:hypothetical protein
LGAGKHEEIRAGASGAAAIVLLQPNIFGEFLGVITFTSGKFGKKVDEISKVKK